MPGIIRGRNELYLCHENKEKKRCPHCGNLSTKKKGFSCSKIKSSRGIVARKTQRYFCKDCQKSFSSNVIKTRTRMSEQIKIKAVTDYVLTKNSLSEVGSRYNVSKTTVLNWLLPVANKYPSLCKIQDDLTWSGIIQIDGKEIKIKGKRKVIFVASDSVNKKPILYRICDSENIENSRDFLITIKKIYPVKVRGVISDFGRGKCFIGVISKIFPDVPHQTCLVHFMRYVWMFLPRTRKSKYYWRNNVLKWIIKKVITASSREESLFWLGKIIAWKKFFIASYHPKFIRSLINNYEWLTRHYEYDFLKTNTNIIENINRQLERKIKNLDGFKSENNAQAFLHIWFAHYRLKT